MKPEFAVLDIFESLQSYGLFASDKRAQRIFVALDEVGRGCLAGPVVAGASLWIATDSTDICVAAKRQKRWLRLVKDSKQLTAEKRAEVFSLLREDFDHLSEDFIFQSLNSTPAIVFEDLMRPVTHEILRPESPLKSKPQPKSHNVVCLGVELGVSSSEEIDTYNIWNATQLAMARATSTLISRAKPWLTRLAGVEPQFDCSPMGLLVDGKQCVRVVPSLGIVPQITAIEGDGRFLSVGVSSIAAKVARDKYMEKQALLYPDFQFEKHKGYATAVHRDALKTHKPTPLHRLSFLKNFSHPDNAMSVEHEFN